MAEKKPEDYRNFSLNDFLLDDYFQRWVQNPDAGSTAFWQAFARRYPQQVETLTEAREILLGLQFKSHILSASQKQQLLEGVYNYYAVDQKKKRKHHSPLPSVPRNIVMIRKYRKIAAVATLLMMAAVAMIYQWYTAPTVYTTAFGETDTFTLADGTVVKLNANSRLEVDLAMEEDRPREVRLTGEAYFKVARLPQASTHYPAQKQFIVHTDELKIEVLGTQFNVNSRRQKTQVVLNTGSVKVLSPALNASVIMQPGEIVELGKDDNAFRHEVVNPETYTAWKDQMFIFDNVPLWQVAQEIETYYGVKVIFADTALARETFRVEIQRGELDMLLQLLEASFPITLQKEADTIILKYVKE